MLGVVCGALHVADGCFQKSMSDFLHSLERCYCCTISTQQQLLCALSQRKERNIASLTNLLMWSF